MLSGIRSGLRYVRHSLPLRALIIRNLAFSGCASALWALLPLVARDQLRLGAGGFGMLVAFFGAGAVVGALWIPRHLQRMPLNTVVTLGYLLWIIAVSIVAAAPFVALAVVGTCAAGAAWVSVLATLSAGTQSGAPGLGAGASRVYQPGRKSGEPGAGQRDLGGRSLPPRTRALRSRSPL